VLSEAAYYDWNGLSAVMATPSGVRMIYGSSSADAIATGSLYASFQLTVTQAPLTDVTGLDSLRPGFFAFSNSTGSAHRGRIGINPGSTTDTFVLGVSSGSQVQSNFSFSTADLALNTPYMVVIGYDTETTAAQLWIDPVDQSAVPVATAAGANTVQGIRRLVLNLDNSDGAGGFSQMGQFTLDNLVSATTLAEVGVAVPEPATYALLFGMLTLGAVLIRRRR